MEQANYVIAESIGWALSRESWALFGYSNRPRYGTIFQKLRPNWKVRLEKKIIQEMIITCISHYVLVGVISDRDIEYLCHAFLANERIARAIGYDTPVKAGQGIKAGIIAYTETRTSDWDKLLLNRLDFETIDDKKYRAQILTGIVRYCSLYEEMIAAKLSSK